MVKRTGRFIPEKALENEVPKMYWNRLQKGMTIEENGKIYTPDMILGSERKGLKLTYCTDTRPVPQIVEHAMQSDLFICEGMYGEKDKQSNANENKHMTFYEAAQLAKDAQVNELWLTHYSPSLIHPEEYMKETKTIFPKAKAGKDRKSITLEFDKDE
jgi:ribonuclease Z